MSGKFKTYHILLSVILMGLFTSCNSDDPSSSVPVISFNRVEIIPHQVGNDSLMVIYFDFEDRDGDLGLRDEDTTGPFKNANNLFINIQEKTGGTYLPIKVPNTNVDANFNQRIPSLTPEGRNKQISGTIGVSFLVDPNEIYADTVAIDLYVEDRAFQKSNVIEQKDIALNQ